MALKDTRNLGPVSAEALSAVGLHTREDLVSIGWEAAWERVAAILPRFAAINMGRSLAGAELGCDWRELPPDVLARVRKVGGRLRHQGTRFPQTNW